MPKTLGHVAQKLKKIKPALLWKTCVFFNPGSKGPKSGLRERILGLDGPLGSLPKKRSRVTISLLTGGQGHPTPIHTPTPTPTQTNRSEKSLKSLFCHFSTQSPWTNRPTDQWTNGQTDQQTNRWKKPPTELRVRNWKGRVRPSVFSL